MISPLAQVLQYQFPVHRIHRNFLPQTKDETFLIAYRNQEDDVLFDKIDVSTAYLIQLLQHNESMTGKEALETLASAYPANNRMSIIDEGYQAIQDLYEHGIICKAKDK